MDATRELVFLGTGAACGNPSFFCGCPACREALDNPAEAKTCSSAAILGDETTLIDTAPELRMQLAREGIRRVNRILFTHEHFDHTGGLPQLEFAVRLAWRDAVPIYGTARCLAWLEHHFDWVWDTLEPHVVEPFDRLEFDGVSYTALPASHCPDALGYLVKCGAFRLGYFPDTGPLPKETLERLQGVDVLVHDSTFIGRNWMPETHTNVDTLVRLGRELGAGAMYLQHCSLHYDEPHTGTQLRRMLEGLEPEGMRICLPHDGLRLQLG